MNTSQLRNIGIIAHVDAGKTTFTERALYYSGVIRRMGEVHEGSSTTDFLPEEQERGITIAAACVSCPWKDCLVTIIDTPGHVDFSIEVERSLRVLDGAVGIFCGVSGVEPQSEHVWRQAGRFTIPTMAVINKMDREGADFSAVVEELESRLGARVAPVTIPFGQGEDFAGVLDLLHNEALFFDPMDKGMTITRTPFDKTAQELAEPWKQRLFDVLTEDDDALLELCLLGKEPSAEQLKAVLRKSVLAGRVTPVFAAAAAKNMGIQPVLDGICDFFPTPEEVKEPSSCMVQDASELCALVFKVVFTRKQGMRLFIRLYNGTLTPGDKVYNVRTGESFEVQDILRIFADGVEPLEKAVNGDVVAITGVNALTGDTLTFGQNLMLEPVRSNAPVIAMAFEPQTQEEDEALYAALMQVCKEDPTISVDRKEGQTLVSGMGELHLEVLRDRLEREFHLGVKLGKPHVVCREVIAGPVTQQAEFSRTIGEDAHLGRVTLAIEPLNATECSDLPGSLGDGAHVPHICHDAASSTFFAKNEGLYKAVKQGIHDALACGCFGFPVCNCQVTVSVPEEESKGYTQVGMQAAARLAAEEALRKVGTLRQEPLMRVCISVPNSFVGNVLTLLNMCDATVVSMEGGEKQSDITAHAPLSRLFGFSTELRSSCQGRADMAMDFLRMS